MRLSIPNLRYAVSHPNQALRYLANKDTIPYSEIGKHLPDNPVILEAGAANGVHTVEMAEYWPNATIHAFEPVPEARQSILERTAKFGGRVKVYENALGDEIGSFKMHVSGTGTAYDSQSSSLLPPTGHTQEYDFVRFESTIDVPVTTLDAWADEHDIRKIDFLWFDMQGFELRALSGGPRILRSVLAAHLEVANIPLYQGAPLYPEVAHWMASHQFCVAYEAIFRIGGNVLFTRSKS